MSKSEKRYLAHLIVSIVTVAAVCTPGSPLFVRGAAWSPLRLGAGDVQQQPPAVDRTTSILAKMTPAQQRHSELFEEYRGGNGKRMLDELTSRHLFIDRMAEEPRLMSEIAGELRCASDDVFLGQVESYTSYPTADGTFLFSEYQVRVTEDVTNQTGAGRTGTLITVVQPGGAISVQGVTLVATSTDSPLLLTQMSYLFFAKRIAATGAYRIAQHRGVFLATDAAVLSLQSAPTIEGDLSKGVRKDLFLNAVRASGPCR